MRIVWDEPKRLTNLEKHRLDFANLSADWLANLEAKPSRGNRLSVTGELDGKLVNGGLRPTWNGSSLHYFDASGRPEKDSKLTTRKWPSFETWDISELPDFDEIMQRRWEVYDREMRELIAKGGVHQDRDGWWVDDATGELIGPDPEIERPLTDAELAQMRPLEEVLPELAAAIKRSPGRPRSENPKAAVTLRLDPQTVARFEASGPDWRRRMAEILDRAAP